MELEEEGLWERARVNTTRLRRGWLRRGKAFARQLRGRVGIKDAEGLRKRSRGLRWGQLGGGDCGEEMSKQDSQSRRSWM